MSYDKKAPKILRLTGPLNYRIWAKEVQSFLKARGLFDLVLGNKLRPNDASAASSFRYTTGGVSTRARGRTQGGARARPSPADTEEDTEVFVLLLYKAWRCRNARARTYIIGYCSLIIKNKIIDLLIASEQ